MKLLKISPEYECSPLWIEEDNNIFYNLSIAEAPFDEKIKIDLYEWANRFELTFNRIDPPESGFRSLEDEVQFEEDGYALWTSIRDKYSGFYSQILYRSIRYQKTFNGMEDYLEYLKNR